MAKKYLTLSTVLKKLLREKRMRPADLAREANMPVPTIHRLVTGKSSRPHKSSLEPLADYFSLTVDQLTGREPLPDEHEKPSKEISTIGQGHTKTIPIYKWQDSTVLDSSPQPIGQIATSNTVKDHCFALIMNDYSMEPLFPKGAILLLDHEKEIQDRSYVLVKLESVDVPIFRQILIDADYKYLKPLNAELNRYKMRVLNNSDTIIASLFESRIIHDTTDLITGA